MNFALLGLTVFAVVLVLGTVFWLIATLGPLHKKQKMRRAEGLGRQAAHDALQRETPGVRSSAPSGPEEKTARKTAQDSAPDKDTRSPEDYGA
ncbi:hypothetical protein [Congregibacter litoralis]|uniref:Uncharacterized protein n=1 Tax=Congregibacter litoralis KT71 TaxID=314285 RepID=A4A3X2_9GAMM|nr:hypothetical protein [Congregibacter litoralis]EAQ99395.1 hypothetical protein KT71_17036 [Congregibacter litoralis KT71]